MPSLPELIALAQASLRRHTPTILRVAGGVSGATVLGLLVAGGVIPFLPQAAQDLGLLRLWGSLSGNVLASWLQDWATTHYRRAQGDDPASEQQLLTRLATDLQQALADNAELGRDVAILLQQADAVAIVLETLQDHSAQQLRLLQLLLEDVQTVAFDNRQLHEVTLQAVVAHARLLMQQNNQLAVQLTEVQRQGEIILAVVQQLGPARQTQLPDLLAALRLLARMPTDHLPPIATPPPSSRVVRSRAYPARGSV